MRFKNCKSRFVPAHESLLMVATSRPVRVITMALGNITCIIAAACLTYLPSDLKWNRLIAYWFTNFQVSLMSGFATR